MKISKAPKQFVRVEDYPRLSCPAFASTLKFPDDITNLDAANVSLLMGRFTQMLAWASQARTDADIRLLQSKAVLESAKTRFLAANPAVRNSSHRWRIDFVMDTDPDIAAAQAAVRRAETSKLTASNLFDTFERYVWVLSRELSRKTANRDGLGYESRSFSRRS